MKTDPEAAGFDPKRLARITDHLRTRYIEPQKIAGCQVLVARHGEVAYFESLGRRDLERQTPVEDDTIWRIYSMTKPITGVALMTLYERGHFQLNDPVDRFIPEWKGLKVAERMPNGRIHLAEPGRPMSVRDALMHTTGLGWGDDGPLTIDRFLPAMWAARGGRGGTLQSMVERMAERPLVFQPGTKWLYGLSTDVCGKLVEAMSGMRFDEYLRTEIFEPLGMVDTAFHVPEDKTARFAANYVRRPDKTLKLIDDPLASAEYGEPPAFLSGGGGLVSTTADYYRFCRMLAGGGEVDGVRILSRKTLALMTSNHLPDNADLARFVLPGSYGETMFEGVGFGLTMAVSLGPVETQTVGSKGEFYWGGAASTIFWVDPAEDLVAIFMTQLMPSATFNFRGQLKSIVYGAIAD